MEELASIVNKGKKKSNPNQIQFPTESLECDWGDAQRNVNQTGDSLWIITYLKRDKQTFK